VARLNRKITRGAAGTGALSFFNKEIFSVLE
jgi:hypothetical protein